MYCIVAQHLERCKLWCICLCLVRGYRDSRAHTLPQMSKHTEAPCYYYGTVLLPSASPTTSFSWTKKCTNRDNHRFCSETCTVAHPDAGSVTPESSTGPFSPDATIGSGATTGAFVGTSSPTPIPPIPVRFPSATVVVVVVVPFPLAGCCSCCCESPLRRIGICLPLAAPYESAVLVLPLPFFCAGGGGSG